MKMARGDKSDLCDPHSGYAAFVRATTGRELNCKNIRSREKRKEGMCDQCYKAWTDYEMACESEGGRK